MEFKLGDHVLCRGCMKKTGYHIEIETDDNGRQCGIASTNYPSYQDVLEDGCLVPINKIEDREFDGYICGQRPVAMDIYCDTNDYGYIRVYKENYIDCYEVCIENRNHSWGKRMVPKNLVYNYHG